MINPSRKRYFPNAFLGFWIGAGIGLLIVVIFVVLALNI